MEQNGTWPPAGAPVLDVDGVRVPVQTMADPAFPSTSTVCKRFPTGSSANSDRCRLFDLVQSASRVVVERTFGILCSRFRVFRGTFEINSQSWISNFDTMLRAASILHNLSLDDGFVFDDGSMLILCCSMATIVRCE